MPNRSSNRTVQRELTDALQRLKAGTPTDPQLISKGRRGMLRINPTTVAKEAGHSRTLISHDHCAYPDIRKEILRHAPQPKPPKDLAEANKELRKEVAEMRRALRIGLEERVAMLLRMKKLEENAMRGVAIAERRAAKALKEANEVAGKRLRIVPNDLEVVELTPNRDAVSKSMLVDAGTEPLGRRSSN